MRLIELHILQSFPVSCLNRDDVGSPKTAVFGGARRARLSSQCLKRATRLAAKEILPDLFAGERSKLIVQPLADELQRLGIAERGALEAAKAFCDKLATYDEETFKKKEVHKVKTLMFLSPAERKEAAAEIKTILAGGDKHEKKMEKVAKAASAVQRAKLKDAADIAIFGRMVASDHTLTVEGAGMFGHALSTHQADNDIDFFSAVDDRQRDDASVAGEDLAGAGMMGALEFTSAVYYRFAALNLDLLADGSHLGDSPWDQASRRRVVDAFIRASLMAVPSARQNSMNAHTLPGFVLGVAKDVGQPVQLINAFEEPVFSRRGLLEDSAKRLREHHSRLKETWGMRIAEEVAMPDANLDVFTGKLVAHVA